MRVGAIELRLLEHCNQVGPTTIREAAESFGKEQGIGLTTVQQMMERLRKKELLSRAKQNGIWVYKVAETRENLLRGVVAEFVDRTFGGSLEPFMLYLVDRSSLSSKDLDEVRQVVDRLSAEVERNHDR